MERIGALGFLATAEGCHPFNLGTSRGCSVLVLMTAFERASDRKVPNRIARRREDDVAELWADTQKTQQVLGWRATKDIDAMCRDSWHWQSANPQGYKP